MPIVNHSALYTYNFVKTLDIILSILHTCIHTHTHTYIKGLQKTFRGNRYIYHLGCCDGFTDECIYPNLLNGMH